MRKLHSAGLKGVEFSFFKPDRKGGSVKRVKAHKDGEKVFSEETYAEQARTITATINNLKNEIDHHIQHAPASKQAYVRDKCRRQIYRLLGRVIGN